MLIGSLASALSAVVMLAMTRDVASYDQRSRSFPACPSWSARWRASITGYRLAGRACVPTRPSLLAQLPADVERVLAIGLAKDPRDRFAFALELARWFPAAVAQGLDLDQRRRADDLIARYPWGQRTGPGS